MRILCYPRLYPLSLFSVLSGATVFQNFSQRIFGTPVFTDANGFVLI